MLALLAVTPLATVLATMLGLGWSAARAGAAGLLVATILAYAAFDFGATLPTGPSGQGGLFGDAPGALRAAFGVTAEAIHSTAVILWIILPALALYEYQRASGAIDRIRNALASLTDEPRLQAILLAWFFGLFMEGAAGFGTPVALAAPLLVGIGFAPVRAVTLALLGHAAAVSFGAVGTPVLTQAEITGVPAREIAFATAALHGALGILLLLAVVRLAGPDALTRRDLGWTAFAAAAFLIPYVAIAALAGPELPALGGALAGLLVFATVLRRHADKTDKAGGPAAADQTTREPASSARLARDLVPYLAILVLVLATRLLQPLRDGLSGIDVAWSFADVFEGAFAPLYHPGSLLLAGLLLGALSVGNAGLIGPSVQRALRRIAPVAVALLVMLALSRVMVHTGMIDALAAAAARSGALWPLFAPLVGVLGTFVTGSATASNILFSEFQATTAAALSVSPTALLAAQGFGAAIGNVVAPHNIIAGCATVGLVAREGEILSRTAPVCAIYALAGGALLLAVLAVLA